MKEHCGCFVLTFPSYEDLDDFLKSAPYENEDIAFLGIDTKERQVLVGCKNDESAYYIKVFNGLLWKAVEVVEIRE